VARDWPLQVGIAEIHREKVRETKKKETAAFIIIFGRRLTIIEKLL
jgi:hypothetical protein